MPDCFQASRAACVTLLAIASLSAPAPANTIFSAETELIAHEVGGWLLLDTETGVIPADWSCVPMPGALGGLASRWSGSGSEHAVSLPRPDETRGITRKVRIHTPGNYRVLVRHRGPGSAWLRVDRGEWLALDAARDDDWTWRTLAATPTPPPARPAPTSPAPASSPPDPLPPLSPMLAQDTLSFAPTASVVAVMLNAGDHELSLMGRTAGFVVDGVMLLRDEPDDGSIDLAGANPGPPSSDDGGGPSPHAIHTAAWDIPAIDAHSTVFTFDASSLTAPLHDARALPTAVTWTAPGAHFVHGTEPHSSVAALTFDGEVAEALSVDVDWSDGSTTSGGSAGSLLSLPWSVSGTMRTHQPFELLVQGPEADEAADAPNPFLDMHLEVRFRSPDGRSFDIPGFFDGDGSGGPVGDAWRVRFSPDMPGVWGLQITFLSGAGVAVAEDTSDAVPLASHGAAGRIRVLAAQPDAPGFQRWGRLEYVGRHHLKFRDGPWFLKGGTNSPENLLAFVGFDDVSDSGGVGELHDFEAHVADWKPGDPDWGEGAARGIIGALNYLGSVGVNSVYFLPMNLGGDGQDVWPFLGPANNAFDKTHYDVSRLAQWNTVFEHAMRQGILLHIVLNETESANENWLDGGSLGVQRKLFYRELVARFAHHPAIKWNLCEENDFSIEELRAFAAYLRDTDAYDHPIAVHTKPNDFSDYEQLVGEEDFEATSIQYSTQFAGEFVETCRTASADAGRPWIVELDENMPWYEGLSDTNAEALRKHILYDVYFSGGNIEWYAGTHDLPLGGDTTLEDFRTREEMWHYMRHARRFLEQNFPFWMADPHDELLLDESGAYGGGEVLAWPGVAYAIYISNAMQTGRLDLTDHGGAMFKGRWYDPRTGLFAGNTAAIGGGGMHSLGPPPSLPGEDWVYLVTATGFDMSEPQSWPQPPTVP